MSRWIEVSLRVDGEGAEALAEVLGRFGHQGVALEQDGIAPDTWDDGDVPPPETLILRAYFPDDDKFAATRAQLETALGHMRLMHSLARAAISAPVRRRLGGCLEGALQAAAHRQAPVGAAALGGSGRAAGRYRNRAGPRHGLRHRHASHYAALFRGA